MKPQNSTKSDEGGDIRMRTQRTVAVASLPQRSLAPLAESPISVYLAGVGLGMGCGALVLLLLLGVLSV